MVKSQFKKITLEELAAMCMREFTAIRSSMATKADLEVLESRVEDVEKKIVIMDGNIVRLEKRFDRFEEILLEDHAPRIRRIEQALLKR